MKPGDLIVKIEFVDAKGDLYDLPHLIEGAAEMSAEQLEKEIAQEAEVFVTGYRRSLLSLGIPHALWTIVALALFASNGFCVSPGHESGFSALRPSGDSKSRGCKVTSSLLALGSNHDFAAINTVTPIRVSRIDRSQLVSLHATKNAQFNSEGHE